MKKFYFQFIFLYKIFSAIIHETFYNANIYNINISIINLTCLFLLKIYLIRLLKNQFINIKRDSPPSSKKNAKFKLRKQSFYLHSVQVFIFKRDGNFNDNYHFLYLYININKIVIK